MSIGHVNYFVAGVIKERLVKWIRCLELPHFYDRKAHLRLLDRNNESKSTSEIAPEIIVKKKIPV